MRKAAGLFIEAAPENENAHAAFRRGKSAKKKTTRQSTSMSCWQKKVLGPLARARQQRREYSRGCAAQTVEANRAGGRWAEPRRNHRWKRRPRPTARCRRSPFTPPRNFRRRLSAPSKCWKCSPRFRQRIAAGNAASNGESYLRRARKKSRRDARNGGRRCVAQNGGAGCLTKVFCESAPTNSPRPPKPKSRSCKNKSRKNARR